MTPKLEVSITRATEVFRTDCRKCKRQNVYHWILADGTSDYRGRKLRLHLYCWHCRKGWYMLSPRAVWRPPPGGHNKRQDIWAQAEEIRKLYLDGLNQEALAKRFGCARSTISQVVKDISRGPGSVEGLALAKQRSRELRRSQTLERGRQIREMVVAGLSIPQAASQVGLSVPGGHRALRKYEQLHGLPRVGRNHPPTGTPSVVG